MISQTPPYYSIILADFNKVSNAQKVLVFITALFNTIKEELLKVFLYIKYYLHKAASCLDQFDRKKLFEGGTILGSSKNWGKIADMERYLRPAFDPTFKERALQYGYKVKNPYLDLKPLNGGICNGLSFAFARAYQKEGLEIAATKFEAGGGAEVVLAQEEYTHIHRSNFSYYEKLAIDMATYIKNPDPELIKKNEGIPRFKAMFLLAKWYVLENKPGNFLEFVQSKVKIEGIVYSTFKRVDLLLLDLTPKEQANEINLDSERVAASLMGVSIEKSLFHDASARKVIQHNWTPGIYKLIVPCCSNLGNSTIFNSLLFLCMLGISCAGFGYFGYTSLYLEHIGLTVSIGSLAGMLINKKKVVEGYHAVIFIKEDDQRYVLYDPNLGTGIHHSSTTLLTNLFKQYQLDLTSDQFQHVDVQKLKVL